MLDRTIPFYNMILRCDNFSPMMPDLYRNYELRMYHKGDEQEWARLEYEIGDFNSRDEAETYFLSTYCSGTNLKPTQRCVFAVNQDGEVIGSCIAWQDFKEERTVASLHWLIVSPRYQGQGIGIALCQKVLQIFKEQGEFPVYVHTQPWSYKAIMLYIHQGFKIQKTDCFSEYENQFQQAMDTLQQILPSNQYEELNRYTES